MNRYVFWLVLFLTACSGPGFGLDQGGEAGSGPDLEGAAGSLEETGGDTSTGGASVGTGGSSSGGQLVETGGAFTETGGQATETGGAFTETGGAFTETGGSFTETGGSGTGGADPHAGCDAFASQVWMIYYSDAFCEDLLFPVASADPGDTACIYESNGFDVAYRVELVSQYTGPWFRRTEVGCARDEVNQFEASRWEWWMD